MRCLVTGGAGFIGSHLCRALSARGAELIVLDNFTSSAYGSAGHTISAEKVIYGDIRQATRYIDQIGKVDLVIHLAALISGFESMTSWREYISVNIEGTMKIIELLNRICARRIVFASSSTVYGQQCRLPIDEDAPCRPETVYAATKLMSEKLLEMYADAHGYTHVSLRLFNVYGPGQSSDHPYANVACKFCESAANGRKISLYGDGRQTRDFIFIDDAISAFMCVMRESRHTVYNVGTGAETSISSLIFCLERLADLEMEIEVKEPWPNDIRRICADASRLSREFGWKAKVTLEKGLSQTLTYFSSDALK